MCKELVVTRFKNRDSFNDLGEMTVSNKDYNHKHGQSTAFDGLRAVMLNIKVFWDVKRVSEGTQLPLTEGFEFTTL